jgi:hypothetical protein
MQLNAICCRQHPESLMHNSLPSCLKAQENVYGSTEAVAPPMRVVVQGLCMLFMQLLFLPQGCCLAMALQAGKLKECFSRSSSKHLHRQLQHRQGAKPALQAC